MRYVKAGPNYTVHLVCNKIKPAAVATRIGNVARRPTATAAAATATVGNWGPLSWAWITVAWTVDE